MAICPNIVHFSAKRARSMHDVAWRGMWICVRSKDAQKQLARTSLNAFLKVIDISMETINQKYANLLSINICHRRSEPMPEIMMYGRGICKNKKTKC